ncbi:MAG: hypothetical protein IT430_04510 [Phycisphaerales bacterium]|nr:hypothetical protein [Phycisphaerales bacterium]
MYTILACWIVWLLALWCGRQFRATFPVIDPQLFKQPGERAGDPETGV